MGDESPRICPGNNKMRQGIFSLQMEIAQLVHQSPKATTTPLGGDFDRQSI
ncbi:uncharacterized protein PHALS_11183 [Plasmopara halstedii]|uniref:Uncharacterized protein n=1 Tax=Plasmopara halstedii TaxID=4781 RepID=A0A0P1AJL0_PLAHL|nr:uncharacterized protein PHALS_11183 [Plasmopara halstedii]CEG41013.1 hypothetical protein PHALS_11183 [Plasmopara halstedii]|eukprot:XP_024577382.1 hypothetical protein PHALS_11183 [Plasmopara halstedii]